MFDLATAKTRLKITGTAQDVELQGALDAALALAESYCERWFLYQAQTEERVHFDGATVSLKRYPLESVTSINDYLAKAVNDYHIDKQAGLIKFDAYRTARHKLTVNYTGGYKTLPADLELALWQLFGSTWNTSQNAGSASVIGAGAVQSITSEGQTVRFSTGVQAGGSGAFGVLDGPNVPFSVISILDLYRREVV